MSAWRKAGWLVAAMSSAGMLASAFSQPGFAQSAPVSASTVQAALRQVEVEHMQVRVVAIDPAANKVTLRGPRGQFADVDVNPAIVDTHRLRVGDRLNVAYQPALLIRVNRVESRRVRERLETTVALPASAGRAASAHRVRIVATVVDIDRDERLLTLHGPGYGQVLRVARDVPLDDLNVGDSVQAEFVSALAVALAKV